MKAQMRVAGKGARVRLLPLPPETIRTVQCYLKTERPLTHAPEVFVSLKGPARGTPMTPAGLRSLFRHHRVTSGVAQANPHPAQRSPRHTFGSDMIRAGIRLPAKSHIALPAQRPAPSRIAHSLRLVQTLKDGILID